jgi:hypothetical protein
METKESEQTLENLDSEFSHTSCMKGNTQHVTLCNVGVYGEDRQFIEFVFGRPDRIMGGRQHKKGGSELVLL